MISGEWPSAVGLHNNCLVRVECNNYGSAHILAKSLVKLVPLTASFFRMILRDVTRKQVFVTFSEWHPSVTACVSMHGARISTWYNVLTVACLPGLNHSSAVVPNSLEQVSFELTERARQIVYVQPDESQRRGS